MDSRCLELIGSLDLKAHPEGGFFRRVYRSAAFVSRQADQATRAALTSILYLLPEGAISLWHRVASDEAWHHYEGSPVEVLSFSADGRQSRIVTLGMASPKTLPVHVVPAGWWQAARPMGAYALLGCTVAPGFEYADFILLADTPADQCLIPAGIPEFHAFL